MALPPELLRRVSREEINALPIRRYEGPVSVISAAHQLGAALDDLLQERLVGFDTETRPAFRPGESYPPSLAQLATARAVYLFQVRHPEVAAAVARVLGEQRIVKTGVSVADDLKSLKKLVAFSEKSVVDVGALAQRHGLQQSGVRNLAGLLLGFRIPKGTKTSNWARQTLTEQQIVYAATDAWACRELYLRFEELGLNDAEPQPAGR
jgi:ribonuclease D